MITQTRALSESARGVLGLTTAEAQARLSRFGANEIWTGIASSATLKSTMSAMSVAFSGSPSMPENVLRAFTPIERNPAGFYARQAEIWATAAVASEVISKDDRERCVAALHADQAANRLTGFFSEPARTRACHGFRYLRRAPGRSIKAPGAPLQIDGSPRDSISISGPAT